MIPVHFYPDGEVALLGAANRHAGQEHHFPQRAGLFR